jgi:methionyl-tRNA formyltransferase
MKFKMGEVKRLALAHGLEVLQPTTLKSADVAQRLRNAGAAVMVVAAYGLLVPPDVLALFERGCINIHASLLPRWRGAAPIQRAILGGDSETGISIMLMDAGLDSGPVLLTETTPILPDDTAGALQDRLAVIGGRSIVRALSLVDAGELQPVPQPAEGATYARKIDKAEAVIDWTADALAIERKVRAFNPVPVASTTWRDEPLRVWRARAHGHPEGLAGRVVASGDDGVLVACGRGALQLLELQRPGGRRLSIGDFLRGSTIDIGETLGR